jgi:cytochrome c biogenesis protein ResB
MKRFIKALASPIFMVSLLVLLIITLATATFIENDFGAQVARHKVYNAWWFEVLLVLLAINLLFRVLTLKLYKPAKFSVFLFHIAFVFMLIGAGITRYFGEEGSMHIRESQSSNRIQTIEMNNGSSEIKLPF